MTQHCTRFFEGICYECLVTGKVNIAQKSVTRLQAKVQLGSHPHHHIANDATKQFRIFSTSLLNSCINNEWLAMFPVDLYTFVYLFIQSLIKRAVLLGQYVYVIQYIQHLGELFAV